jgi:hypothetical protein
MYKILSIIAFAMFTFVANAQKVKVTSGKIQGIANFQSKLVDARNIDIWLPDEYSNKENMLFCILTTD